MLGKLWCESITFRRIVASLSVALAALAFYLASSIPQTASLPNDDIDRLAVAHANEELRIYQPKVDAGDPVLSFEGAANVGAEVWAQQASLTGSSARFAVLAPPGPVQAVYAAGDEGAKATGKDCRTSLTITRADDSSAPQILNLWQSGKSRDDLRFRQITISSPQAALNIEVSTDSPPSGQAPCPRLLTMGKTAIPVPAGPVDLLVPPNQTITLLFSAMDSTKKPPFSAKKDTFDGLSLGDGDLGVDAFEVASNTEQKIPLLRAVAHKGASVITLHDLKLGAEEAALSVGEDTEQADAWASGRKFPVLDLVDKIQKNPVLSFFLAAVLIPGLWKWIQQSCFPKKREPVANQ